MEIDFDLGTGFECDHGACRLRFCKSHRFFSVYVKSCEGRSLSGPD
jgi:hypothetical protein